MEQRTAVHAMFSKYRAYLAEAEAIRFRGLRSTDMDQRLLAHFPRSVVPEERRRRVYWNGVLARAEVNSAYRPARKLWKRERQGHYLPSSVGIRVAGHEGQPDVYVPLDRLLALDILEPLQLAALT